MKKTACLKKGAQTEKIDRQTKEARIKRLRDKRITAQSDRLKTTDLPDKKE